MDIPQPFHPVVVHFPIALFITALLLEVIGLVFRSESLQRSAVHVFVAAAIITPFVVWTGNLEHERLHLHHPLLEQHKTFAEWTMWLSLCSLPVLWVIHKKWSKFFPWVFIAVLIGVAVLVTLTGDRGGTMVYEYGVGMRE